MASITDLPTELTTSVCGSFDRADILSLRHTSRRLAVNSADAFENASFDSITVTCSKAGLERLERLTAADASSHVDVAEKVEQIKHVTIHAMTAS